MAASCVRRRHPRAVAVTPLAEKESLHLHPQSGLRLVSSSTMSPTKPSASSVETVAEPLYDVWFAFGGTVLRTLIGRYDPARFVAYL